MSSVFDEFRDAAAEGLSGIVERGKTGLQISRLRSNLRRLEKSRREKLAALGERAYRMLRSGALDQQALRPDCDAITALEGEMSKQRAQIADLERSTGSGPAALARCTCGQALTAETRFCRGCGKDVEAIVKAALARGEGGPPGGLLCACGAPLAADTKFCGECGRPVAPAEPQASSGPSSATGAVSRAAEDTPPEPRRCECGASLAPAAKFCPGCGRPVERGRPEPISSPTGPEVAVQGTELSDVPAASAVEERPVNPATRSCPWCGNEIPFEAKFCRHCGRNVVSPATGG